MMAKRKIPTPATIVAFMWLTLLLHIQEVLGSNLGLETSYHD
jgi:hypothetical protein